MKKIYIILLSTFFCYAQTNDTLIINDAIFQDLAFNNYTKNFELVLIRDDGRPKLVSVDSNNNIVNDAFIISTIGDSRSPAIDVRNGIIVTAWRWFRTDYDDWIISSVIDTSRGFLLNSNQINRDGGGISRHTPDISFLNDSLFFVCWSQIEADDNVNDKLHLKGKVVNIYKNELYEAKQDCTLSDSLYNDLGRVKLDINENAEYFPITWRGRSSGNNDGIYGRIFDKKISPQSDIFTINTDTVKFRNTDLIFIDSTNFLSCYVKYTTISSQSGNTFLSKVNLDGVVENSLQVNDELIPGGLTNASISMNSEGYIIVVWDENNGKTFDNRLMGQRFDPLFNRIGNNFIIVPFDIKNSPFRPKVKLINKRVTVSYIYGKYETDNLIIKMFDFDNPVPVEETEIIQPVQFSLSQNYPNPFNPQTSINFSIPKKEHVQINLYDISGKKVKTLLDETKNSGSYKLTFNIGDLASGLYLYRLQAGAVSLTKKLVLLK